MTPIETSLESREKLLKELVAASVRAPSADNTQPWRFVIDAAAGRIAVHLVPERDPTYWNSGARLARMAVGGAIENLIRTAQHFGWRVELEEPGDGAVAVVRVDGIREGAGPMERVIGDRVTNRRFYDRSPISEETLAGLRGDTPPLEGVRTLWMCERDRLNVLARIIGRSDATMIGEPTIRRAFLSKIRFDAPVNAEVEEGMPLGSMEILAPDRAMMRLLLYLPAWAVRATGVLGWIYLWARSLVRSASGGCFILAPDNAEYTDVLVGRAYQRAWLAMTARGLCAQPMSTLMVLENGIRNGGPELVASLGAARVAALGERLRQLIPEIGDDRLGFFMRFGVARAPSARTGRLPIESVVKAGVVAASHATTREATNRSA